MNLIGLQKRLAYHNKQGELTVSIHDILVSENLTVENFLSDIGINYKLVDSNVLENLEHLFQSKDTIVNKDESGQIIFYSGFLGVEVSFLENKVVVLHEKEEKDTTNTNIYNETEGYVYRLNNDVLENVHFTLVTVTDQKDISRKIIEDYYYYKRVTLLIDSFIYNINEQFTLDGVVNSHKLRDILGLIYNFELNAVLAYLNQISGRSDGSYFKL